MKKQIITGLTGIAAALALVGVAQADPIGSNYATCVYKGETSMTHSSQPAPTNCWLQVIAKMDCATGHVHITGAGANHGDASCMGVATSNLPWGADIDPLTGAIVGGVIDTDHNGSMLPSVYLLDPSLFPYAGGVAFGVLSGVSTSGGVTNVCSPAIPVPNTIEINGSWPGGDPSLQTIGNHLTLRGCF